MVEINRNIYLSICIVNVICIVYNCVLKVYSGVSVCDKIYDVLVYWLFL